MLYPHIFAHVFIYLIILISACIFLDIYLLIFLLLLFMPSCLFIWLLSLHIYLYMSSVQNCYLFINSVLSIVTEEAFKQDFLCHFIQYLHIRQKALTLLLINSFSDWKKVLNVVCLCSRRGAVRCWIMKLLNETSLIILIKYIAYTVNNISVDSI